jgi:hypothetical protein
MIPKWSSALIVAIGLSLAIGPGAAMAADADKGGPSRDPASRDAKDPGRGGDKGGGKGADKGGGDKGGKGGDKGGRDKGGKDHAK